MRRLALAAVIGAAWLSACVGSDPDPSSNGTVDGGTTPEGGATDAGVDAFDATPLGPRCDPKKPFEIVEEVTELNSSATIGNFTARLTADDLQVFFTRVLTSSEFRIYRATRPSRSAQFGTPVEVDGIGHVTGEFDSHPAPFPAGDAFYFQRTVGANLGDRNILFATAVGNGFTAGVPVGRLNDTAIEERSPYLHADKTMYIDFVAREGGARRRIAYAKQERADSYFPFVPIDLGAPQDADDLEPVVSSDGLSLYFASNRGSATKDIYLATRTNPADPWGAPSPFVVANGPTDDEPSWISADDCELWFHRVVGIEFHIFRVRRPL